MTVGISNQPGLSTERTRLARHRTLLGLAASAVIMARITADDLGLIAFTVLLLVPVLLASHWWSRRPGSGSAAISLAIAASVMCVGVFEAAALVM